MKRIIAISLAILMVFSIVMPLNAKGTFETESSSNGHERPVENNLKSDDILEKEQDYIVVLDDDPKFTYDFYQESNSGFKTMSTSTSNDLFSEIQERKISQQFVKAKINDLLRRDTNRELSLYSVSDNSEKKANNQERSFKVLFNGFTISMKPSEMDFIRENVSEIEKVYIDYKYKRPDYKVSPNMYHTNEMIKSNFAWNNGFKGEGRVVAVIDSGADVDHPAMRITDETKVALTKEKVERLISENLLKGEYQNPKFPYAYNFYDHDLVIKDTNPDLGMHGMHVSGTVGANATQEEADQYTDGKRVMGVAPESQILAMRVFSQYKALTGTSAYLEALEESIILGADAANMSLGSISGDEEGVDLAMVKTLENARKAGMIVAIAAGNDFYQTFGHGNPSAKNPDWGVMGTPAVFKDSFAVANYNNDKAFVNYTVVVDGKEYVAVTNDTFKSAKDTGFNINQEYEIVDVGLGNTQDDYAGKDVRGKIVLAQRGKESFAHKMKLAGQNGAIAFLLGNNEVNKPDYFIIMQTQTKDLIPGFSVTYRTYDIIKKWLDNNENGNKLKFLGAHSIDNPNVKKMNDSSSWGPNPNLRLKPEISAPGGNIYSTVNTDNGRYQDMSGTSMATPHVAGAVAILNQFYKKNGFNLENENKYDTIKNSLMISADPILYPGTELYYSPRIQGAGLMNLQNATNPNLVTIVDSSSDRMSNNYAKVEFGSINNGVLDFYFTIHNYSDKNVSYDVSYIVQTDKIVNGKVSFEPKLVKKVILTIKLL